MSRRISSRDLGSAPPPRATAACSSTSSATAPSRSSPPGAPGDRLGATALDQAPSQVGGERLGVAVGDAHAEPTPRVPGSRPGKCSSAGPR